MPQLLTKLSIREVSGVDRGAGEGVRIMLMKRDGDESPYTSIAKNDLSDDIAAYLKREFTADQRQSAERSGAAMQGGGFPIENEQDLRNAIQAVGRAKNPKAAKQHIISRARALGCSDMIPEDWTQTQPAKKAALDQIVAIVKAAKDAEITMVVVKRAQDAVLKAIDSTAYGEADPDGIAKGAVVEFVKYLSLHVPVGKSAQFSAACEAATKGDAAVMTLDELKKHLADHTAPLMQKIDAVVAENSAILKMSDKARALYAKMSDAAACEKDDDKKKVLETKKADFLKKKPAEQDADAAEDAKDGDDADKAKKALDALPPAVRKALDDAAGGLTRAVDLEKRLAAMDDVQKRDLFEKRATEIGLAKADGDVLRKAYGGDAEAQKSLEGRITALARQANPDLFREFGKGDDRTASPYDALMAKADELRKTGDGAKLSRDQAFSKVYSDPANIDLVQAYKGEHIKKIYRAA